MKILFENWQKFLKEAEESEGATPGSAEWWKKKFTSKKEDPLATHSKASGAPQFTVRSTNSSHDSPEPISPEAFFDEEPDLETSEPKPSEEKLKSFEKDLQTSDDHRIASDPDKYQQFGDVRKGLETAYTTGYNREVWKDYIKKELLPNATPDQVDTYYKDKVLPNIRSAIRGTPIQSIGQGEISHYDPNTKTIGLETGESPEVVRHELGHAIDWGTAPGDINKPMSKRQLQTIKTALPDIDDEKAIGRAHRAGDSIAAHSHDSAEIYDSIIMGRVKLGRAYTEEDIYNLRHGTGAGLSGELDTIDLERALQRDANQGASDEEVARILNTIAKADTAGPGKQTSMTAKRDEYPNLYENWREFLKEQQHIDQKLGEAE
jgi:hypothetical protein